jgi:hypothetical protein
MRGDVVEISYVMPNNIKVAISFPSETLKFNIYLLRSVDQVLGFPLY